MKIPPTETKSVHIKTYVEPTVSDRITDYQVRQNLESTSAAVRELIIRALDEIERITSRT